MSMVSFKDLWIWNESHQLMIEVHELVRCLPRHELYKMRNQIERSSSSVPDNISEGYTAYYYKDKIKGMYTARKEAGETQNHIESLKSKGYVDSEQANKLSNRYERVMAGINSFINYIRDKRLKTGKKGHGKSR